MPQGVAMSRPFTDGQGTATTNVFKQPSLKNPQRKKPPHKPTENEADDYSNDPEETIYERISSLGDMFPEHFVDRSLTYIGLGICMLRTFYRTSRQISWLIFSSALVLVAPVAVELQRLQMQQEITLQERSVLFGDIADESDSAPNLN